MSLKTRFSILFVLFALLVGPGLAVAQDSACDIRRLGGPNRFHDQNIDTVDELRSALTAKRADLETVMRSVGWLGDANDFFEALDGPIPQGTYESGTTIRWMAVRKKGEPVAKSNTCWGGKQPFEAYTVNFESNGYRWHFAVPKVCGNVALIDAEKLAPAAAPQAATCNISASCQAEKFVVDTGGSSRGAQVTYTSPSGKTGTYDGPFEPMEDGQWTFKVEAGSGALACSEQTQRDACAPPKLKASLNVTPNPAEYGDEVTIQAGCTPSDRAGTGYLTATNPDDKTTLETTLEAPYTWTGAQPFKSAGQSTITFRCDPAAGARALASDTVTERLLVNGQPAKWIVRAYGGWSSNDDSEFQQLGPIATPREVSSFENREMSIGNGTLFGATAEYMIRSKFGLEFGIELGSGYDAMFVWDTDTVWGMDHDDLEYVSFLVAPNYHFTQGRRADVYAGPVLAYGTFDDLEFTDQGFGYNYDVGNSFGWGAQLGLDIPVCPVGRCFHFSTKLKYMNYNLDPEGPVATPFSLEQRDFSLGLDTFIFAVGAGYRF